MAMAMAPGLEKVIVYEADPNANPFNMLNRMATDTNSLGQPLARQLSSSWSWPGYPNAGEDQIFQQFAAQGQSFFQASGDYGAYCASCPPEPPMESTNITIVGGTTPDHQRAQRGLGVGNGLERGPATRWYDGCQRGRG